MLCKQRIHGSVHYTDKEEAVNVQSLIRLRPKFCRHCASVVLSSGIKKSKQELPYAFPMDEVRHASIVDYVLHFSLTSITL